MLNAPAKVKEYNISESKVKKILEYIKLKNKNSLTGKPSK